MNTNRTRTARPKLSPIQFIKGSVIRIGLAEKVKVRGKGRDRHKSQVKFRFIWHRIGILVVAMALIGWTSLATAAYFFVKHARDFPEVRWVDLAFPHRWEIYETARGDYYIAQAQELLEAGETSRVIHLLRVGVNQSPDNTEGRLLLAQIYSVLGRPDLGIDLLKARAAEHADNIEYLRPLISLLFANHEDAEVEALANRILAGSTEPTDRNLVLAIAAATANFNRGNYDRAQQIIDDFDLTQARTGMLLQARVDWELGYGEIAIQRLETIMRNPGAEEEQVVNYLIEYLWSSGRQDRARQFALSRFVADPLNYAPRIRLLHIHNRKGDAATEAEEVETFLRLFSREEEALRGLIQFAAQTAQPELAERIFQQVRANGHPIEWPALALIDAHVAAGNYRQALDTHRRVEEMIEELTPLQRNALQGLLAVAHLGVDNTERGDAALSEILTRRNVNPGELLSLAERLIGLGEFSRAREVLSHLHVNQPRNQEALSRLIRLDIETGNNREIVRNLERLLQMRKPSQDLLETAHRHISSDRFLFHVGRSKILQSLESALLNDPSRTS